MYLEKEINIGKKNVKSFVCNLHKKGMKDMKFHAACIYIG